MDDKPTINLPTVQTKLPDGSVVNVQLPVEDIYSKLARIDERLNNHITHFSMRLDSLDKKFWALVMLTLGTLVSALLPLVR